MNHLTKLSLISACVAALVLGTGVGCGKDDAKAGGDEAAAKPVPDKPANGSPISAKFIAFTTGKRPKIKAEFYNHGDKKAAGYVVLAKFIDKDGNALKFKKGTPFEKDFGFTSLSGGRRNVCEPKAHCTIEIWFPDMPEGAEKAELLVSKVDALADDGMQIGEWWTQEGGWSDWPGIKK